MASTDQPDPLLLFRQTIAAGSAIIPTTSPDSNDEVPLSQATHLVFSHPARTAIPVDAQSRFMSTEGNMIDIRSIYFAWINRDITIPDYNAAAEKLNAEMTTGLVHKFAFVERLNLITWLEGAGEEATDFIKPLGGDKSYSGMGGGAKLGGETGGTKRSGRGQIDARLAVIYDAERKMGDRNTVLRGIKPTDFSHIRKLAAQFMVRKPSGPAPGLGNGKSLALNQRTARRPDPIILLSPSASSLLRMSNAKAFLEGGRYTPPDHNNVPSMLRIQRSVKEIDPSGRPWQFVLVEGIEQFKPEYWSRVVAVFTTGQTWQFKSYKWSNPSELFKHVQGIYLGWRGEQPPDAVRSFGHKVLACPIEKWRDPGAPGAEQSRWRDREAVEQIWKAIEANMRTKGWKRDAAPTSI